MTIERHLILREFTLRPSTEGLPCHHAWFMARVADGSGYWLQRGVARSLNVGDVIAGTGDGDAFLRASRIGPLRLQSFEIRPQFLGGLLTLAEQQQLEAAAKRTPSFASFFAADHSIGCEFARLAARPWVGGLPARSGLLKLWMEAVAGCLIAPVTEPLDGAKLRERFRHLVGQMPESELAECSVHDLARRLGCSERHVSRLFRSEFGIALRTRQTELRLQRARQLLTESGASITDVAYDSGYRHLGLFNTMFKKHFGMTPSEWRRQHGSVTTPNRYRNRLPHLVVRAVVLLALIAISVASAVFGQTNSTAPRPTRPSPTNTNPPSDAVPNTQPSFEVRRYVVSGNTVLSQEVLDRIFADAVGPKVGLDQIREALAKLAAAYRERGFVTVAVSLPQQQITNAVVAVRVIQAPLACITVIGNRHFSSNDVLRALPSLRTNILLNSQVFQRELDVANANRDRQIYPVLEPGPEPGTAALTLKVKDRLPLHGRFEFNNLATPGTPELRMNLNAEYDNLWDLEHQVGAQYSFTPEMLKNQGRYADSFLDDPLIANYSTYYRLPLAAPQSVQEQLEAAPLNYGYSEVTHQFRLPPPPGQPTLTFYGSRLTTDTGVQYGPRTLVTQGSFITIESQDSGENFTLSENLGSRLALPLPDVAGIRSTLSVGYDFKRYQLTSFNSNNFYVTTVITNAQGSQTIEKTVSSPQPVRNSALDYLPATAGLDLSVPDQWGVSYVNATFSFNWLGNNADFARAAYTTNAQAHYMTLNVGFSREQKVYKDWSVSLRANGQWADGPLISNEQFGIGGTQGVRGYREGEQYGDTGWRVLIEPRTPQVNIGMVDGTLPFWVRGSVFMDYGESYLHKAIAGLPGRVPMWGTGFAVTGNIGDRFDLRLTVGVPLRSTAQIRAGDLALYFGVGAQF